MSAIHYRVVHVLRQVARLIRFYCYPIPYLARNYLRSIGASLQCTFVGDPICLDLGAGTAPYKKTIINAFGIRHYIAVDIAPSDTTSVVADASKLPFNDQAVSLVVSMDVLQHIPDPLAVLNEIYRVLLPGGLLIISFPFLYGECDAADYRRWSIAGMENDLAQRGFEVLNIKRRGGLFFSAASGLHLAAQLVIPGGRKSWRSSVTPSTVVRSAIVVVLTIPTTLVAWLALLVDFVVKPKSLLGYYMGALMVCRRPPL